MVVFELFRQLDVRVFMTVAVMDRNFGACSKYIIQDDSLIVLGMDHSVRLNMSNKSVTVDAKASDWDIDCEPVLWFAEDSAEACIIRLINNAFRQWMEIDSFASDTEFEAVSYDLNSHLTRYHLRVYFDSNSLNIFHDETAVTFEEALEIIMEVDTTDNADEYLPEWFSEAEYYKSVDQLEEAAKRYERILKTADSKTQLYTVCSFRLAECYYFLGNNDRAVILYYRCSPEFIDDNVDFFTHLGHALLDSKMKKYERQIRIYYRSLLDRQYAERHAQALKAASHDLQGVFDEYEKKCLEMGEKKYHEHRSNLPPEADDIDELLIEEASGNSIRGQDTFVEKYERLRLFEPQFVEDKGRSTAELITDAYDCFCNGDYQNAFNIYYGIKDILNKDSEQYSWVMLQLGKIYAIFDEYGKAREALLKISPDKLGVVYKKEDFLLLYEHVKNICEDYELDLRFRSLIRGKIDAYYAQTDRMYLKLMEEKDLMKAFADYENDCAENSMMDFLSDKEDSEYELKKSKRNESNNTGLFGRLGKIFKK